MAASEANYDESLVPDYTLPDPLLDEAGVPVTSADAWRGHRRAEVLRLFDDHVYGRLPPPVADTSWGTFDEQRHALDGTAIRRQVRVTFGHGDAAPWMDVLLYLPSAIETLTMSMSNLGSSLYVYPK